MLKTTYDSTCAPFSKTYIYSNNYISYNYGWENSQMEFMQIKDILQFNKLPYGYEIIKPIPKEEMKGFIELKDIPIPRESMTINAYIHLKSEELNKSIHFSGSTTWFGINRNQQKCNRCEVTRTNMKIDIDDYITLNKIDKHKLDDYILVIEGEGKLIKNFGSYKVYNEKEIIQDGSLELIIV
jgi:hypothetical protein